MKRGMMRVRHIRQQPYLIVEKVEAQLLIEALDALNRETGKEYGELRSCLVRHAYETDLARIVTAALADIPDEIPAEEDEDQTEPLLIR